jgi:primosomal protein N' (replication factor Y)
VRLVDMNHQPPKTVFSPPLLAAIGQRIARGEQSLVFLNRRGYAPVLACGDCDWRSECSALQRLPRVPQDRPHAALPPLRLHRARAARLPKPAATSTSRRWAAAPSGSKNSWPPAGVTRGPTAARCASRAWTPTARKKRARWRSSWRQVHAGEVDVLVGTQMITKGHDFRRITLVAAVNPDGALFSSDFRAPERLFSLLMQAAGRAGRDAAYLAAQGATAEMWIQTHHAQHPLFMALRRHDYTAFAKQQLDERRAAGMPPFAFQALLRADAREQATAQAFLNIAADAAEALPGADIVTRYPAVPLSIQRVANVERAQMLIESPSRAALQRLLASWQPLLHALRRTPEGKGVIRWLVDVDPHSI